MTPATGEPISIDRAHEAPIRISEITGLGVVTVVLAVAVTSLVAAWAGLHDGLVATAIGVAVAAAVSILLWRRWSPELDVGGLVTLGVLLVAAAVLFFPGFPYAANSRDPGVYVNHAVAMAREGSITITDPLFETGADLVRSDSGAEGQGTGARALDTEAGPVTWRSRGYLGLEGNGEELRPKFFHLWPSLLATAHDLGGPRLMFNVAPMLATASIGLIFLTGRRAFGAPAGAIASLVLLTTLAQVWQAKYPSSEVLTQHLFVGALFAVSLAIGTRSRLAAAAAGAAVASVFLTRADGLYLVGLVLTALAARWATGRADQRDRWVATTLVPLFGLGLYQAYGPASLYSETQKGFPSLPIVAAGITALVAGTLAVRVGYRRWGHRVDLRRADHRAWIIGAAVLTIMLLAFWLAPSWQGVTTRTNKAGELVRAYDELNLRRLGWLVSVPGMVVAVVGLWIAALRAGPGRLVLLPGLAFLPVLLWEPRIAPFLMWWARRFTPVVIPTLALLIGLTLGWVAGRRRWFAPGIAALLTTVIVALNLTAVWPMRDVIEFGGSRSVVDLLDDLDEDAVLVWDRDPVRDEYAVTPVTWHGLASIDPNRPLTPELLEGLAGALPDRTLYVVTLESVPPAIENAVEPVSTVRFGVERWPDTYEELPSSGRVQPLTVVVSRYVGGGTPAT